MLLAHRNNYFEKEYSFLGADLVISGHGHGGVIRLPFTDGLLSVGRAFYFCCGAKVTAGSGAAEAPGYRIETSGGGPAGAAKNPRLLTFKRHDYHLPPVK